MLRGEFLDVLVQWTIYPVENVLHRSFPPGIYGLGLLLLGFLIFFWSCCPSLRLAKCSVSGEIEGSDNKTSPLLFVPFLIWWKCSSNGAKWQKQRASTSKWILISPACGCSFPAVWKLKWHHLPKMRYWPCFTGRKIEVPKGLGTLRSPGKALTEISRRENKSQSLLEKRAFGQELNIFVSRVKYAFDKSSSPERERCRAN